MRPLIVIRSNLESSDMIIYDADPLESSLETLFASVIDPNSPHFISSEYLMYRLIDCTSRIQASMSSNLSIISSKKSCPIIFDSWSCFNSTEAGQDQVENCPSLEDLGFKADRLAVKRCNDDGTWWVHPETNKTWTNYTNCMDLEDVSFHYTINKMTVGLLVISLISLFISLLIFSTLRSLHCIRITIHTHMFVSIALNNLAWLFW